MVYLGIDVGTQGTKAGVYDREGTLWGEGYAEHTFDHLRPGWVEMDPDQITAAVLSAAGAAVAASGRGAEVRAVAMSGILCGPVLVDADLVPVRPIIPFLDTRAADEVAWLTNEVEPLWIEESANSSIDTYVMPATVEWVRRHEPEVHARIAKVCSLAPYVGARLAGLKADRAFTDPSHLSGWIIGWQAATGEPSARQLDALGIPVEWAPTVHRPDAVVGAISAESAAAMGIPAGTPLAAGAGDVMQSNLGAGLTGPGLATDVAGTASILTVGVDAPVPEISAVPGMLYTLSTLPNQALYWGYVKAGGLSLRWFRDEVLRRPGDDSVYVELDAAAAGVAPGSDGVLFTPYLSGGNPDNPNAAGTWLGMSAGTSVAVLWRSMLESIAYEYADFLDVFAQHGVPVNEVLAIGGGARSPLWNAIKADAIGIDWRVPTRQEGAILANAALAAVAVGDLDDLAATVSSWVQGGAVSGPQATNAAAYQQVRQVRADLLAGPLRQVFDTMATLRHDTPSA